MVFIVDDDLSLCAALGRLFRSVSLNVKTFTSAQEFLKHPPPEVPSCLVLDVRLPGLSGLDFQAELAHSNIRIPIVFMTGYGDIPMTVKAMKAGAVGFLSKPFRDQDILDAVSEGIELDRARRENEQTLTDLRFRFNSLTARQKEVMVLVVSGFMNKQIAAEMQLAEITIKLHRGSVMRKMGANSLADLVRSAELLGIRTARP